MLNLPDVIRSNRAFDRLSIGDVLIARYTCPLTDDEVGLWAESDYLVHVLTGRKTWRTAAGTWTARAGDAIFFKKGACIVEQHREEEFCVLMFFIPDALVREVVNDLGPGPARESKAVQDPSAAIRVLDDVTLTGFFHSMRTYFAQTERPPEALLRLKLKELLVGVMTGRHNPELAAYLGWLAGHVLPPLASLMEANFRHNLPLEAYARMSHRSLSSFKREFHAQFGVPPGQWLRDRRLAHAAQLLRATDRPVTEIAFDCGFEDASHFTKAFHLRFGQPPSAMRNRR
ncbi:MAG: helix-turn-helix transcriptional regulator [Opitutaceae bacterium]|nr:helix-turn-helix transcriptional regulator [Opitutaceae bacterium]